MGLSPKLSGLMPKDLEKVLEEFWKPPKTLETSTNVSRISAEVSRLSRKLSRFTGKASRVSRTVSRITGKQLRTSVFYRRSTVRPGQESVRKGEVGKPALLIRFTIGLSAQPYRTATGLFTDGAQTIT